MPKLQMVGMREGYPCQAGEKSRFLIMAGKFLAARGVPSP